jgi:ABC-2 type transport system permease protein
MRTIFSYQLSRLRGQVIGWGIGLALLALLLVQFYSTVVEQADDLQKLIDSYPPEMMAFFGGGQDFDFISPAGYLNVEFFSYMPLILGIFAVLIGSGLLSSDEEAGRLDLLLAYPIERTPFFVGRVLAFIVASLGILCIVWLSLALPSRWNELNEVSVFEMALPCLVVFAQVMFFGGLALLFSQVLPSRRTAATLSGLLLVAGFFLPGLAQINDVIEPLARFSPMYYYQGGEAINGLNMTWLFWLSALAALFVLLAWWRFERRDIRVGGEGGLQWSRWRRLLARAVD